MTTTIGNSGLIADKLNTIYKQQTTGNQTSKPESIKQNEEKHDSFENQQKKYIKRTNLIGSLVSGAICLGLIFLPELIFFKRHKKQAGLMNFKSLLGDDVSSMTQTVLKNGMNKVILSKEVGKYTYNEIIISKNLDIKRRILLKKETLPSGKTIIRHMKSYTGNNIIDNSEIKNNESKYLFKEYTRSRINNKEDLIEIVQRDKPKRSINVYSNDEGQPVMKIEETRANKEYSAFLYDNDQCIGLDKEIKPKNGNKSHHIVTIPDFGINKEIYDDTNKGKAYSRRLLNMLTQNY